MILLLFVLVTNSLPQYMILESADEGMSSWRHAVCEFFAIAIRFNATVAEPCVVAGRISSCTLAIAQPLSAFFDLSRMRQRFRLRLLATETFDEIVRQVPQEQHLRVSMHSGNPPLPDRSLHDLPWVDFEKEVATSVVLTLFHYRKFAKSTTTTLAALVAEVNALLTFAEAHFSTADDLIRRMYQGRPYAAVHWRSEQACRNYTSCTARVVETRNRLCVKAPHLCPPLGPPVLLISDLTENYSVSSWPPLRKFLNATHQIESSHRAYEMLLGPFQFFKIDSVLQTQHERQSDFRPIWDLIMGARASILLTCDFFCRPPSMCAGQSCAYVGSFVRHLKELRQRLNTTAAQCW